jgi:hypothetical protein
VKLRRATPKLRRSAMLAVALPIAIGVSGCHQESHPTFGDGEGVYVDAGKITYQVQLSRELNPFDTEDKHYLAGLPATETQPAPDEEWFAVWLWAKNQSPSAAMTSDSFALVDTQGTRYTPVPLNPNLNPFAWTAQTLESDTTEPTRGSPAFYGPIQGGELLFKIKTTAYNNRPLELEIYASGQPQPSTISLDL